MVVSNKRKLECPIPSVCAPRGFERYDAPPIDDIIPSGLPPGTKIVKTISERTIPVQGLRAYLPPNFRTAEPPYFLSSFRAFKEKGEDGKMLHRREVYEILRVWLWKHYKTGHFVERS